MKASPNPPPAQRRVGCSPPNLNNASLNHLLIAADIGAGRHPLGNLGQGSLEMRGMEMTL